jgi:hypothetical protein
VPLQTQKETFGSIKMALGESASTLANVCFVAKKTIDGFRPGHGMAHSELTSSLT